MKTSPRSHVRLACWLVLPAAIALAAAQATAQAPPAGDTMAGWKAGVARAVITPETSVWLAGYGSKRPPDGKLHELWMKALALESSDGSRAVLITSDFQGVPKSMSDRVFSKLREQHGLERRQVMLTFSHNHCGPRLGDDLVDYYPVEEEQVRLVAEYTDQMVERCVQLVGDALADLAPAELRTGQGQATFAVNRRNNREAEVPDVIASGRPLAGPVDHTVPVLTVTRPNGQLAAILFGYACHPTTLSFLTWCGDYPGFAQAELERRHPGATAMFVNTCGGDQNPLPRRSVELCQRYGHELAVAVEQTLTEPLAPVGQGLRTAFELIELPYLQVVGRDELHGLLRDGNAIRARWAARMLQRLDNGETFPAGYPYPVHAWRLGADTLMIGTGAETVVDYALRFKREFGPRTWVCGYADDMIAYIPSRRVWDEGGYEGGTSLYEYGRPAFRWSGEVEERIAAAVHKLATEVGAPPSRPAWDYSAELMRPFWEGETMVAESVLFLRAPSEEPGSGEARASVLFPIEQIVEVRDSAGFHVYEEGRDFRWSPGSRELVLPAGSRIVSRTPAELRRPAGSQRYALTHRDGDGEILFGGRLEYAAMQTVITYRHSADAWQGPRPKPGRLPRATARLRAREPLAITVLGDSISAGANASGEFSAAPFQPAYPELLRRQLAEQSGGEVRLTNLAVGGTDTAWGLTRLDAVVDSRPDVVVLAFGMNDAAGRPVAEYRDNTRRIMERLRERLPDVELVLVAPMLGNRDWTRLQAELFPGYRDALAELAGATPGVALADLTSVWTRFLEAKHDWDQTGNGVNHPNDFGHRVYAQVLTALMLP